MHDFGKFHKWCKFKRVMNSNPAIMLSDQTKHKKEMIS